MPKLLDENITTQIREIFSNLQNPVHLLFFGRKQDCDYCEDSQKLVEEVAALSDKLSFSVHDIQGDDKAAFHYQVDKAPGIVLAAKDGDTITDLGIRYAGIPSGHEFSSFIQDIILASARDSGLSAAARSFLQALTKPIHLQVFVTPT
jgi:alkyl hydroperoxide reductase subunit AhpF